MSLVNFAYKLNLTCYLFNAYIIIAKTGKQTQGPFGGHFSKLTVITLICFLSVLLLPGGGFLSILTGLQLAFGE